MRDMPVDPAIRICAAYSPPPSEWTYSVTLLIVAGSSRAFQFGITPICGLVICATIASRVSP